MKTPRNEVSHTKRLRESLPILYTTLETIIEVYDLEFIAHLQYLDEFETFRVLTIKPTFIDMLEGAIEWLVKNKGFREKKTRDWLLNKLILILRTIYSVHMDHTMLPIKHLQRINATSIESKEFIQVSMDGRPGELALTIKIPMESELYC